MEPQPVDTAMTAKLADLLRLRPLRLQLRRTLRLLHQHLRRTVRLRPAAVRNFLLRVPVSPTSRSVSESIGNRIAAGPEHREVSTDSNIEPGKSGRSTGSAQPYHSREAGDQPAS